MSHLIICKFFSFLTKRKPFNESCRRKRRKKVKSNEAVSSNTNTENGFQSLKTNGSVLSLLRKHDCWFVLDLSEPSPVPKRLNPTDHEMSINKYMNVNYLSML